MSRVMCVCSRDEAAVLRSAFGAEGPEMDVVCCDNDDHVVDQVMADRPDVLVYELRPDSDADPAVLWLVQHVAPRVGLVLVGEGGSVAPDARVRRVRRTPPASKIRDAVHELLHGRS